MAEAPKASVFVLTHDHVDWIGQALDSALAQQAPFEFELLVADDFSTDGTREMVLEYAARHPEPDPHLPARPQPRRRRYLAAGGACVPGRVRGDPRGRRLLDLARQARQAGRACSTRNPGWSSCFHRATLFFDDGSRPARPATPAFSKRRLRPRRPPSQLLHPLPDRDLPARCPGDGAGVALRLSLVRLALSHLVRAAGGDRLPRRGHGRLPRACRRQLVGAEQRHPAGGRPQRLRAPGGGDPGPARADRALRREPPLPAGGRGGRRGAVDPGGAGRAGASGGRAARLLQRPRGGRSACRRRPIPEAELAVLRGPGGRRPKGSCTTPVPKAERRAAGPCAARSWRRARSGFRRAPPLAFSAGGRADLERRVVPDLGGRCRFRRFRRSARGSGGRHGRAG